MMEGDHHNCQCHQCQNPTNNGYEFSLIEAVGFILGSAFVIFIIWFCILKLTAAYGSPAGIFLNHNDIHRLQKRER